MAFKIPKLYKTETLKLYDQDVEIRGYRVGDGPLVATILSLQDEITNNKDKNKNLNLGVELQESCLKLAIRGLKRLFYPECKKLDVDELDDYIPEDPEEIEIDPNAGTLIAWTMIGIGLSSSISNDEEKAGKKPKSPVKKKSQTK